MNYAFAIDNRRCIGCHACSTACKAENSVPLGVHRTWVKYVEKGSFPHTRRYFQVTRCNHCENPPCVPICPTTAMFRREDGIVEFDSARCIGCKACLQACPYDAIHVDPESGTAAKCHFCAHRIEVGLEPACVIVCPVHAILAGDMDDPKSETARLLATERVAVRKPEQGTRPKLFYVEAEESALLPMLAVEQGGYLWGDPPAAEGDWRGPVQIAEGRMAGALLRSAWKTEESLGSREEGELANPEYGSFPRETYNVPHRVPWHWQVPAYLVTKAVGAGMFLLAAVGSLLGLFPQVPLFTTLPAAAAVLLMAVTSALLVADLERPERFWTILIRPQWRSWLTRGAWILILFSAVAGAFLLFRARWLLAPGIALAILAAVYTAFLFGQAEGRDLWQSPLLSWHLFVQTVMAGAAGLLLASWLGPAPIGSVRALLAWTLVVSVAVNLLLTVGGEFGVPHASVVAKAAARMITRGRYRFHYRASLWAGLAAPLGLLALSENSALLLAAASALAIAGLFLYEWAFVFAPQQVPNS